MFSCPSHQLYRYHRDFDNPAQADFDAFCTALEQLNGKSIHVHCIYNARVTAFFYRYALEGLGGDRQQASDRMDGILRPSGIWAKFINKSEDGNQKKPLRWLRQ